MLFANISNRNIVFILLLKATCFIFATKNASEMNWFKDLTGFAEGTADEVRSNLHLEGEWITSLQTGRRMRHGNLSTPSLADLRAASPSPVESAAQKRLRLREALGDVAELHADPANAGAVFQVASQFNLLEMVGPTVTPADGITRYYADMTQGPACAIACGAATLYRQFFVPVPGGSAGHIGQSPWAQLDCLKDLGTALGNHGSALWKMQNGYALPSRAGLAGVRSKLSSADDAERDRLRGLLRIGVVRDAQVTVAEGGHCVHQTLCSALPVGYTRFADEEWEPFARLVLEAAYEATLAAAVGLLPKEGPRRVYLTMLGGGVFRNHPEWICDAIRRALRLFRDEDLDVAIVSYSVSSPDVSRLVQEWEAIS